MAKPKMRFVVFFPGFQGEERSFRALSEPVPDVDEMMKEIKSS